jgi:hypothetical protein
MDALTFIAEITKALAWPIAATIIAIVFRRQLIDLMARIRKGKLGPAEFEFEERVREVVSEAQELELPKLAERQALPSPAQATAEARLIVMDVWLEVERAVHQLAVNHNLVNALLLPGTPSIISSLRKAGIVSPELASLYRDLRALRNQAAHEFDFSPSSEAVVAYVRTAKEFVGALDQLRNAA